MSLRAWVCNPHNTGMAQLFWAFATGVLLAPWGTGLFFLVVFIIVYEIAFAVICRDPNFWRSQERPGIILASILGWIIGRQAVGSRILEEGVPELIRRWLNTPK